MNVFIYSSYRVAGTPVREVFFEAGASASDMLSWFAEFAEDGTLLRITDGGRRIMKPELSAYVLKRFRAKFDEALANCPDIGCWNSPRSIAIAKACQEYVDSTSRDTLPPHRHK